MKLKSLLSGILAASVLTCFAFAADGQPTVHLEWAEQFSASPDLCHCFIADTAEPQSEIVFFPEDTVTDFQLLSLFLEDVDENGNLRFSVTPLCTLAALSPDIPLLVNLTFYGDLPGYGIAYTDTDGTEKQFCFGISGMDGSLFLSEF